MTALKQITIVGGGLAGLTLGIGLRQRGIPVTVFEAGRYPRHRVCGEFICGNGPAVLKRLGLLPLIEEAGAIYARTAKFIAGNHRSPVRQLAAPALCLSRYVMDAELANEFQRLGGELKQSTRWQSEESEGLVRASGRRAQATAEGWRWFGLKTHARNLTLSADLEMHVSSAAYVGVNRINDGEVNVCGLFRARTDGEQTRKPAELLRGEPGSALRERLDGAEMDDGSFCSVAGLNLKARRAAARESCAIGDAVTMIPPVTGNGMSMAFESAELAIGPLAAFSRGKLSWSQARTAVAESCDRAFAGRLAWARVLQWLMFFPLTRGKFGGVLLRSDWLWSLMFTRTR